MPAVETVHEQSFRVMVPWLLGFAWLKEPRRCRCAKCTLSAVELLKTHVQLR